MGRDELALRGRDRGDAARDRAVQPPQLAEVALGVGRVCRLPGRVGLREPVAQDRHGAQRGARVLPPVRLLAGVLAEREDGRVGARARLGLLQPLVDLAARAHHEVGAGERLDVAGARLVGVGIAVGLEDRGDLGAVARDLAREVGGLRRGGDDPRRAAGAAVVAAGAERRERRPGGGASASRSRELTETDSRFRSLRFRAWPTPDGRRTHARSSRAPAIAPAARATRSSTCSPARSAA